MKTTKEINSYETICIIKPDLNEDSLAKIVEEYQLMLVDKGAQNIITQNRGRRHLKYIMKKFKDGIYVRNSFIALTLALSLYTAAFIAEIVRSGILAISKGQTEAASSLGLRPGRIMNLIILPQALRVIVPPMISNYLNLTKNSSLAIAVGYMDVRGTLGGITLKQTGRELESMLLLMGFYMCVSLLVSAVINYFNRSFQIKGL